MSASIVAVLGAYGQVGQVACRELLSRHPEARLLIGGRSEQRAAALADALGPRTEARSVDITEQTSLRRFVASADLVLNCAGPSTSVRDVVARATIEAGVHLIDVGGDERTVGEWAGRWPEPLAANVLVLLDSGWIPGVSGALARLVDERAVAKLDRVDRLAVFCGDRGAWSATGMADVLAVARSLSGPGHFRGGQWVAAPMREGVSRVRLPSPFGRRVATLSRLGELRGLSERQPERVVGGYLISMLGPRALLALGLGVGPLRSTPALAARLLSRAASADARRHGGGGIVAVAAHGMRDGSPARVCGCAVSDHGVQTTGTCGALAAARVLDDELSARGCAYLCDVLEPQQLLEELSDAGRIRYVVSD